MADPFAGGAAGVPFNMLYDLIKEVVIKNKMFRPLLEELNAKIEALEPLIVEMDKLNKELDHPEIELKEFKLKMKTAPDLLRKCRYVPRWHKYKKYKYTNQLVALKDSLQDLIGTLQVQQARDIKKNLAATKNVEVVVYGVDDHVVEIKGEITGIKGELEVVKGMIVQQVDNKKGELQNQIDCDVPELPRLIVGLDGPVEELKINFLWKDEVSMLVLKAPGGCGKTTLATKFCQDEDVKAAFKDNIFFVTVSQKSITFNLIVQGLYQRKSADVPNIEDEAIGIKRLNKFLKKEGQNRVLLVLDDVWSDTEAILKKFDEVNSPNFKILVTSRSKLSCGTVHHVQSLNEADALELFLHAAFLKVGHSNDYAEEIAASCKGYPLLITVLGKSLRGQPVEIWQKKASEWSKGNTINDFETELLLRLKSSLDCLDEKDTILKECFMDLGSFPQDQRIPATALIDMWAELYKGLNEDFLAVANLHELASRSLADVVVTRKGTVEDADGYYSDHFVTQHDMLRQLAVYQARIDPSKSRVFIGNSEDNIPHCVTQQTDKPIKPRLLSICSDETFSTELHNIEQVEVLVLNFNTDKYALPGFVKKMLNLKVLILRNHGSNYNFAPAEVSNFHLLASLPKLKRIRLERISIPSLMKKSVQLKSVKKISLFMCSIGQAFSNCSFPISDTFPYLEELNIDYCNDLVQLPDELCNMEFLKLSITNCHKLSSLPEDIGKLEKLETLRLRSCSDLTVLPLSIHLLKGLKVLDISGCFSIKELPKDIGELSSLENINMRQCSRLTELPLSVGDLLESPISVPERKKKLVVICDEDTIELWDPFLKNCQNVKVKKVQEKIDHNWLTNLLF